MRQYTDGAGRVHVRVQVELMPAEAEAMAALADDFERIWGDGDNRLLNGLRRVRAAYRIERGDGARNET